MNLSKTFFAILLLATAITNASMSKQKEKQWKRVPAKDKSLFRNYEKCDGCHKEQKTPAVMFHNVENRKKLCDTCYHSSLNPGNYMVVRENTDKASISTLKKGDAVNVLEVEHREASIMGRIEEGWVLIATVGKNANIWFMLPTTADYYVSARILITLVPITQYPEMVGIGFFNKREIVDHVCSGDYVKILEIVAIPEEFLIRGRTDKGWVSILDTKKEYWYMQPVSENTKNRKLTIKIAAEEYDNWGATINYTEIPFEISQVSPGQKFHQLDIKEGWKILKVNDVPVSKANAVESEKRLKRKGPFSITFLTSTRILPENVEFEQTAEFAEQTEYRTSNNGKINESMLGDHDEWNTKESTKTSAETTTEREKTTTSKSRQTFPTWVIALIIILCFAIPGLIYCRQKQVEHKTVNHPKTTQIVPETVDEPQIIHV